MRARSFWLLLEAVTAFAVPAYFWIVGLITMPFWLWMTAGATPASLWILVSMFAGIPALIGLVGLLAAAIAREPLSVAKFSLFAILLGGGILGIWSTITGQFETLDFDMPVLIAALAPTLCSLHLLALCARLIGRGAD